MIPWKRNNPKFGRAYVGEHLLRARRLVEAAYGAHELYPNQEEFLHAASVEGVGALQRKQLLVCRVVTQAGGIAQSLVAHFALVVISDAPTAAAASAAAAAAVAHSSASIFIAETGAAVGLTLVLPYGIITPPMVCPAVIILVYNFM